MALKVRYNTAMEVRRTLQRISNAVLSGELDAKRGNTVILAANTALNAIRTGEQDKKIAELESLLKDLKER